MVKSDLCCDKEAETITRTHTREEGAVIPRESRHVRLWGQNNKQCAAVAAKWAYEKRNTPPMIKTTRKLGKNQLYMDGKGSILARNSPATFVFQVRF